MLSMLGCRGRTATLRADEGGAAGAFIVPHTAKKPNTFTCQDRPSTLRSSLDQLAHEWYCVPWLVERRSLSKRDSFTVERDA